jgi:pimeloyl-ACP methyl ester carboxylesterase
LYHDDVAVRAMRPAKIEMDGRVTSYLVAGGDGPAALLLHGTRWSRVWLPVIDGIAAAGLRPIAVDLRGPGCSEGELTIADATVPALRASLTPKLSIWGEDDLFQLIRYAEQFTAEIPESALVRIPRAGHIYDGECAAIARALGDFFARR